MNGQFVGTFIYAHDITILAPSHCSLIKLLNICDDYATKHCLLFNPNKTKCMFFSHDKKVSPFPVNFKNIQLTFVKECHLLGIYLSEDISNRNIEASIQTFIENVTKSSLILICYQVILRPS